MHDGESLAVLEVLTHGSGSVSAHCEVSQTVVAPILDHVGDFDGGFAVQITGVVLGDDLNAFVQVQGLEVPLVPAGNDSAVTAAGSSACFQECAHVFDLGGDGDAVGISQSLVVVDNLSGVQEGHCNLSAVVLSGQNQTVGEVVDVVTGSSDVAVQVLEDTAFAVGSDIVSVGSADSGQTGAGSVGSDQLLVQILQSADVLSLDGDQILRSVETVDDLSDQTSVLIFQGVPPDDLDGLGNLIEGGFLDLGLSGSSSFGLCSSTGGAAGAGSQGQNHDHCQQQRNQFFHFSFSFPLKK